MKITEIQNALKLLDDQASMFCTISEYKIKTRIYVVAQVKENIPGFCLGEREPYMRELTVSNVKESLLSFGDRFMAHDFLFQYQYDVDEKHYEMRYFQLTDIDVSNGEVIFNASLPELCALREKHLHDDEV